MRRRASGLVSMGLLAGTVATNSWPAAIAGAAGAAVLMLLAPVPLKAIARRTQPFLLFALITLVVGGLGEGRTVAAFGPFHWGSDSMLSAGVAAFRLLVIGALFSWVGLRVGTARLVAAMWSAGLRLKRRGLNVDPVLLALAVGIRFLPLLQDEAARLRLAWEARGGSAAGRGLAAGVASAAALAVPLLAAVLRRAEDFANAVDVRTRGGGMAALARASGAAGEGAAAGGLVPERGWRAAACVAAAWAGVLVKVWNWIW